MSVCIIIIIIMHFKCVCILLFSFPFPSYSRSDSVERLEGMEMLKAFLHSFWIALSLAWCVCVRISFGALPIVVFGAGRLVYVLGFLPTLSHTELSLPFHFLFHVLVLSAL